MSFVFTDEFQYKDNFVTDAYRKLRTSSSFGLFNSSLQNSPEVEEWETVIEGTANFNWQEVSSRGILSIGTSSGDRILRQTLQSFLYQSGTSSLVYMTGFLGAGQEGTRARIGIYDDFNGLFFEVRDGQFGVVLRKTLTEGNTVEDFIPQSEFNEDPVDGTGISGYNVDITNAQIFSIDYAWLGVGRVRFSLWKGDCFCVVHQINGHNNSEFPYMGKGDLPLRYEVVNTANTSSSYEIAQICSSVFVEGGLNVAGFSRGITTAPNDIFRPPSDNNWYGLLHLRVKSNLNRVNVNPIGFSIYSDSNNSFHIGLFKNATLPALTWLESTEFTEFARLGGAISGGVLVYSDILGGQRNSLNVLPSEFIKDRISTRYDGSSETFTLAIRRVSGDAEVAAALNYIEHR